MKRILIIITIIAITITACYSLKSTGKINWDISTTDNQKKDL